MKAYIKKIFAFVLVVVLTATSCAFRGAALSAEEPLAENLISFGNGHDGGFENLPAEQLLQTALGTSKAHFTQEQYQWGCYNTDVKTAKVVVSLGEEPARSGNRFLKATATELWGSVRMRPVGMLLPVQQNTDYYLTFWAKNNIAYDTIYAGILSQNDLRVSQAAEKVKIEQTETWQPYRLRFNSGERTVIGIAFGGYKDNVEALEQSYCLDDVALYKAVNVTATAASSLFSGVAGGTVEGCGNYFPGETVTLTAVPQSGFVFSHWVGSNLENPTVNPINIVAASGVSYRAVFKPAATNLIFNGDFENEQYSVGDVWQTVGTKSGFELTESPGQTGNKALKAPANTAVGIAVRNIAVQKGHTYIFSCKYYLESAATPTGGAEQRNNFERIGFWQNEATDFTQRYYPFSGKPSYGWFHNANTEKNGSAPLNSWQTKAVLFTAPEDMTLAVGIGSVNNSCDVDWYIDDIALYDCETILCTGVDANGNALEKPFATLRAAGYTESANSTAGGLRVYNALRGRAFEDGVVVEYGAEVTDSEEFLEASLASAPAATAAAYNDLEVPALGTNTVVAYCKAGIRQDSLSGGRVPVLWKQTPQQRVYTAYITNIPVENYCQNYAVRAYAILSNGQKITGKAEQFSVLQVAEQIDCGSGAELENAAFNRLINWSVAANALYADTAKQADYNGTLYRGVACNEDAGISDAKALQADTSLLKELVNVTVKNREGTDLTLETGKIDDLVATDRTFFDKRHIRFCGGTKVPVTVTCELSMAKEIDNFLISTYAIKPPSAAHDQFGYGYRNYELYFSKTEDNLFADENHVIDYDRTQKFVKTSPQNYAAQIFTFDEPITAKYIGIKFTQMPSDGKLRLDLLGAYSNKAREVAAKIKTMGASLLNVADLKLSNRVETYDFGCNARVEKLLVLEKDTAVFYGLENQTAGTVSASQVQSYRQTEVGWLLTLNTPLYVRSLSSSVGNLLAALATSGEIEVTNTVINNSFLGAGVNVLPMQLMKNSKNLGYRAEFLASEREVIRSLNPKVARVWFQNDWFQTGWYNYNFEKDEFKAFLEYMDIFKEIGTDIELDFSFVVGTSIQNWFGIEGVTDQNRSAPNNLEAFADSVLKCLQYLKQNGYPVKYITLSNEPDHLNYIANAENNNMSVKMEYYVQTLTAIDAALKTAGIRSEFEIWGPECTSKGLENGWLDGIKAYDLQGVIDRYSTHDYQTYYNAYEARAAEYKAKTNGKVCVTEFGTANPTFKLSNVGRLISVANNGLHTALEWCLSNSAFADPFAGSIHDEGICLYKNRVVNGRYTNELEVGSISHEYGPAMSYIPKNSKVLQSNCNNVADLHTAAFEKNGQYTLVVETAPSGNRELKINLSSLPLAGKKLKRIYYNIESAEPRSTALPAATEVTVGSDGWLCESLTATHGMYLYTTVAD